MYITLYCQPIQRLRDLFLSFYTNQKPRIKSPKSGDFENKNYIGHSPDPFSSRPNAKEGKAVWLRETSSTTCTGPIFLTKNIIGVCNTNQLFRKKFIHCTLVIPFILHSPSFFFSNVSNLRKKVLITPGLYFPNYCVTYLPRDISRDFTKCEHVNLR